MIHSAEKTVTDFTMSKDSKNWFVYIIEGSDGHYYTGISTDVVRRWSEHAGKDGAVKKGAKYFRGRIPRALVYVEDNHNRSSASKREAEIKKLPRSEKIKLQKLPQNLASYYAKKLEV